MSIHITQGTGAPTDTTVAPGTHYIDTATGDHYLFGTSAWQKVGGGGSAMSVLTQDASTNASLTVGFTQSDVVLYNQPSSGNITLSMSGIDVGAAAQGKTEITVLSGTPVQVAGGIGGGFVSLLAGVTFSGDVFTPPAGALGMVLRVKQLGAYPQHGGNMLIIEASALTAQTAVNA